MLFGTSNNLLVELHHLVLPLGIFFLYGLIVSTVPSFLDCGSEAGTIISCLSNIMVPSQHRVSDKGFTNTPSTLASGVLFQKYPFQKQIKNISINR
jgi:hypothetical protein